MQIIQTSILSEQQQKDIRSLIRSCHSKCSQTLSFPYQEAASCYLLYGPDLISVLALTPSENRAVNPGGSPAGAGLPPAMECAAYTLPEKQNSGCFSLLLKAASQEIEETDLLFYTDRLSAGALKTLEALEAEHISDEYRMELSLDHCQSIGPGRTDPDGGPVLSLCVPSASSSPTPSPELRFTFHDPLSALEAGYIHAALYGRSASLYSFELIPPLRGQGLGTEALRLLLLHLQTRNISTVFLHVSADNIPALSLYRKTGFRITETLSLYLY